MTAGLAGFDAAAARFDADEEGNPVLASMRRRVWAELSLAFAPGARLVELGSGTGTEASRLARERGCTIALVDPSGELLERATAKVRQVNASAVMGAHRVAARSVGSLALVYGKGAFDGAYSSFGPLNCEPFLAPVALGLADLVRPGGALVLSLINRACPAEVGWFALHGEWQDAFRRFGGPVLAAAYPGGPKDVETFYYSRRDIERAFAPTFRLETAVALPLLWPPPYLDFLVTRFPRFFGALRLAEPWVAGRPVLRDLGDHVLVRLRRGS